ncbi:hypothetical protein chiPu_0017691 [Chiloscyllium punctatum]|uniref:Uncharacterized protein n=1 Tax=Chiloscyllium punctatum TaxID=137246 RepID=A0A401RI37_CHIPU|nr:hypothetical protein [Chiloscyllium punctatum]
MTLRVGACPPARPYHGGGRHCPGTPGAGALRMPPGVSNRSLSGRPTNMATQLLVSDPVDPAVREVMPPAFCVLMVSHVTTRRHVPMATGFRTDAGRRVGTFPWRRAGVMASDAAISSGHFGRTALKSGTGRGGRTERARGRCRSADRR